MTQDRAAVRAFFAERAAGWNAKFADDPPRYAAAIAELGPLDGAFVLDAGCGTGRALPLLRAAVGPTGRVVGVDLTPEMLAEATAHPGVDALAVADCTRLPLPDAVADLVLAAGLLPNLPDPATGLREFARITRPGGRLALYLPLSRTALATRHGRDPATDPQSEALLRPLLTASGWHPVSHHDTDDHFLAVAVRA
ncbi:class I SAM-dependent DNA methyltransferase [Kitasatospora sp. NPDC051853]|uniref:class I SAM-dependent DNA methyltransferase n=1 Tax=Kitasatospora sp. NPDC051853 TaxID=3364058 RepID=UPI00379A8855